MIFSAGLPAAACLPGENTWRIRGEYGDAPGYTRDIPGIPGRGAKPLQIYVPKYALWSSHPEVPSSPRHCPWYPPCNPRGSRCPPPCAAGEDTPCVPSGTANADGKYPPPGTPWVATGGHGLEPAQFDTESEMLEFPPARHRVPRGTTREGRGATPTRTSARCGTSRCSVRPSRGCPANTVSTRGRPGRGKVGSNPMTGNCRPSRRRQSYPASRCQGSCGPSRHHRGLPGMTGKVAKTAQKRHFGS